MSIKTLAGIFEEPKNKKTYKRNFIRENIRSVKQLEYMVQGVRMGRLYRSRTSNDLIKNHSDSLRSDDILNKCINKKLNAKRGSKENDKPTFSERSVQTLGKVVEHSDTVGKQIQDLNGSFEIILDGLKIDDGKHDISLNKEDCLDTRLSQTKDSKVCTNTCPIDNGAYTFCPPGHVLLPEGEREQTLKTLRQKYNKRISELNSLSLRSDTLRIKKKRMEIEEDLRRIDDEIRFFDKHNIFIKK